MNLTIFNRISITWIFLIFFLLFTMFLGFKKLQLNFILKSWARTSGFFIANPECFLASLRIFLFVKISIHIINDFFLKFSLFQKKNHFANFFRCWKKNCNIKTRANCQILNLINYTENFLICQSQSLCFKQVYIFLVHLLLSKLPLYFHLLNLS